MVFFSALSIPMDVRHEQKNTEAYVNGNCLQSGTLYIAESQLFWINSAGFGFTIDYRTVAIHAVSKLSDSFPHESIYMSLDVTLPGEAGDESGTTEVRFVPSDTSSLSPMFQAIAACQRLHPDNDVPEDDVNLEEEPEEEEEDDYCNDDDVAAMPESDQSAGGGRGAVIYFADGAPLPPLAPQGVNIASDIAAISLETCVGNGHAMEQEETDAPEADQFEDAD